MDIIAHIDAHRTRGGAQPVARAQRTTDMAEVFLQLLGYQPVRVIIRMLQTVQLALHHYPLAARQREPATHAVHLTEPALYAPVNQRVHLG